MMRGPGAEALLERALVRSAAAAGATLAFEARRSTRWESATFSGARHEFEASLPCAAPIDRWLGALPDADLPLHGHLLADLAVTRATRDAGLLRFRLEALTVAGD